jgi:hypothetical protein
LSKTLWRALRGLLLALAALIVAAKLLGTARVGR